MALGPKMGPPRRSLILCIGYIENTLKICVSDNKRHKFFLYLVCSITLWNSPKLWFCDQNGPILEVTEFMWLLLFFDSSSRYAVGWPAVIDCGISWPSSLTVFNIDLHSENLKQSFCIKSLSLGP